jgi:hypothetical protein
MVERTGIGEEKLDNTAYTWQALRSLQRMAESKGDTATATWTDGTAPWRPNSTLPGGRRVQNLYADSLDDPGDVQLQQKHWINATPMEMLLAPQNRATTALNTLESSDFTGSCGLFHTGVGGGPTGAGELKCWTLPTSVMAVAEANYGRLGDQQAPFYMDSIAKQLDLEMPGALPEISASIQALWEERSASLPPCLAPAKRTLSSIQAKTSKAPHRLPLRAYIRSSRSSSSRGGKIFAGPRRPSDCDSSRSEQRREVPRARWPAW